MKTILPAIILALFTTAAPAQQKAIELHILANGHVRFDNGPELDRKQWQTKFKNLMRVKPRPDLHILPDRLAKYDVVASFLTDLQNEGYGPHIGFTGIETR